MPTIGKILAVIGTIAILIGAMLFLVFAVEIVFWIINQAFRLAYSAYRGACREGRRLMNSVRTIKTGKYAGRKVYTVSDGVEVLA